MVPYVIQNKVYIKCQTSVSKMWRKIQFSNSVSHYKSLFHNSSLQAKICFLTACACYSRVHISSDSLFSKILKKPFIVQKKMMPHINGLLFSLRWSKKNQNGWLKKFKMAASKKTNSFSSSANSQYFFMKFLWFGPWVSRIDWCEGHWNVSTYMVVRLSDVSEKTA